jgi:hypothetical protein
MWVVVLDDGQTYSGIDGCKVLFIPASLDADDGIDQYVKENADSKGIDLAIVESVSAPLSGDVFIPNLTEIEG